MAKARDSFAFDVDITPLIDFTRTYAVQADIGFTEAFRMGVRGMVRRAMAITPPASRNAALNNAGEENNESAVKLTKDDKGRGERAIEADFFNIFRKPISSQRRPSQKGMEDIREIHARLFLRKTPGRRMRTENGAKYLVEPAAYDRLLKEKKANVGFTAAGWNAGAAAMKITPPLWVRNKGDHGKASVKLTGVNRHAEITNDQIPDKMHETLSRRVKYAQQYQIKAMLRRMTYILNNVKKK